MPDKFAKKIRIAVLLTLILASIVSLFFLFRPPKIAFVRSQELIYNYLGMKEAQNKLAYQQELWKSNLDSLQIDYSRGIQAYQRDYEKLEGEEKVAREKALRLLEDNIRKYEAAIGQESAEMEEKLTQGVLNQVNSFAESYGKKEGYDVILGTTLSGSILYGNEAMDITDELLNALNQSYQGDEIRN